MTDLKWLFFGLGLFPQQEKLDGPIIDLDDTLC